MDFSLEKSEKGLLAFARRKRYKKFPRTLADSKRGHKDDERDSGGPYFSHVIDVCFILIMFHIDSEEILCAAALHDLVEHGKMTIEEIRRKYGSRIAMLVEYLTKIKSLSDAQYFWRISLDIEAIIIKAADRLSNMSDMAKTFSPKRLNRYVDETDNMIVPYLIKALEKSKSNKQRIAIRMFIRAMTTSLDVHKLFINERAKLRKVRQENRHLKRRISELEKQLKK